MNRIRVCFVISLAIALILAPLLASNSRADDQGDEGVVPLVLELIADADKDIRAAGLDQVRTAAKGEAATKRFAEHLPKLPPVAKVGLLSALADRGDPVARPAVVAEFKNSRDESVRVAALLAIGHLGNRDDVPLLLGSVADAPKAEVAAARASLVRMQGEGVLPALVSALQSPGPSGARVAILETLTTRRAMDSIPVIFGTARDADPKVRLAAMTALSQLVELEHLGELFRTVLAAPSGAERDSAEKAVMLACKRLGDADKTSAPLLAEYERLPAGDQLALLSTLGRVGGKGARNTIEAAIASADSKQHDAGIKALCNWPDAAIAPRLIELHEHDDHPRHKAQTLAALIRVAPLPDKRSAAERLRLLQQVMGMCETDDDRNLVLKRARAIRTVETLRYLVPFMDQASFAQTACESVVELAHHRELRDAHKAEFHKALDKVIATSKDPIVIDRANRYKKSQTWVRPAAAADAS